MPAVDDQADGRAAGQARGDGRRSRWVRSSAGSAPRPRPSSAAGNAWPPFDFEAPRDCRITAGGRTRRPPRELRRNSPHPSRLPRLKRGSCAPDVDRPVRNSFQRGWTPVPPPDCRPGAAARSGAGTRPSCRSERFRRPRAALRSDGVEAGGTRSPPSRGDVDTRGQGRIVPGLLGESPRA